MMGLFSWFINQYVRVTRAQTYPLYIIYIYISLYIYIYHIYIYKIYIYIGQSSHKPTQLSMSPRPVEIVQDVHLLVEREVMDMVKNPLLNW